MVSAIASRKYERLPTRGRHLDRVRVRIDAKLEARKVLVGRSTRESTAATMHRQPTPRLIADAKAPLGEISQAKGSGGPYEAGS